MGLRAEPGSGDTETGPSHMGVDMGVVSLPESKFMSPVRGLAHIHLTSLTAVTTK